MRVSQSGRHSGLDVADEKGPQDRKPPGCGAGGSSALSPEQGAADGGRGEPQRTSPQAVGLGFLTAAVGRAAPRPALTPRGPAW